MKIHFLGLSALLWTWQAFPTSSTEFAETVKEPTGKAIQLVAPDGLIASPEPGWPQWRGPRRDGISGEKGLLANWPSEGPRLLWKAQRLGRGWSSPIISGDTVFVTGDVDDHLVVFSFDLSGRLNWRSTNGLVDGRLYLRYHDTLWCYDVRPND